MKRKGRSDSEVMAIKKKKTNACNVSLPDELLELILLKTPFKSLVRFRCVSKSWNTLLTDQDFIHKTLHYDKPNPTDLKFVMQITESNQKFNNYGFSGEIREVHSHVYGSCNGLILLCSSYNGPKSPEKIRLKNPTTGEYKTLPKAPSRLLRDRGCECHDNWYGLCYSELYKDYRVVRIRTVWENSRPFPMEVSVYSLSTNQWRIVPPNADSSTPYTDLSMDVLHRDGVFLNGAFHWIATTKSEEKCILAFDIEDEKFRKVFLPCLKKFESMSIRVSALEGKLCLAGSSIDGYEIVLVMEKYGLKDSWKELFRAERDILIHLSGLHPLCFTKEADGVLCYDCDLRVYDLVNRDTTRVYDIMGRPQLGYVKPTMYSESLVGLGVLTNKRRRARRLQK